MEDQALCRQRIRKSSKPENNLFGRSYLVKSEKKMFFFFKSVGRETLRKQGQCQARRGVDQWWGPHTIGGKAALEPVEPPDH